MITFPASTLLIPYALFAAIFVIFSLVHLYHLGKFGASGFTSFVLAFIYLAGASIIIYWSWYFMDKINWKEVMTIELPNFRGIPGIE